MGWKTFKEKFRINNHTVSSDSENIFIHSDDFSRKASINIKTGEIDGLSPELIRIYPSISFARKSDIIGAAQAVDVFEKSVTIYSYKDKQITEHQCEIFGPSKPTHDGQIITEGVHHKSIGSALNHRRTQLCNELKKLREAERELKKPSPEPVSKKTIQRDSDSKIEVNRLGLEISERIDEIESLQAKIADNNERKIKNKRTLHDLAKW